MHSEYYQISYAELVSQLGEEKANEKVRMYQTSPQLKDIEAVKNGLLLQSCEGVGTVVPGKLANTMVSVFYDKVEGKQLGIKNTKIKKDLSLYKVVELVKSDSFKSRTDELRSIDKVSRTKENKLYKQRHFCYTCFSGTFSYRSDSSLINHSKLICIDLDDLYNPKQIIRTLADQADKEHFILCFISPNGDGVKVLFYADDLSPDTQYSYYQAFSGYLAELCYLLPQSIDKSCKDTSRACFLPHDPDIWVNEELFYAD